VGGLTAAELATIRERLEAFADDLFASLARSDQRTRGQTYLRGLMLDGRRKSIEPMAARLGEVHYQALHHFVAVSPWDWRPVRRRLAEVLCAALEPTAWAVDDTGFPKDGEHSVGVQRQYSGTLGKTANCQLGVSVNAVTEQASCPLDWRLFVPERWDEDAMAERRAACQLPNGVHHRPKWQLVLDMLDELGAWELAPPVLISDSGYGEVGEFRAGLDDRQIPYVVQVKADTSAYPEQVRPVVARYSGRGRRPSRATATSRVPSSAWPWPPGSRRASSSSGGVAARACSGPGSWPCGSARPGSPHADRQPATAAGSCRCAGCWPNGPSTSPSRSPTGCRTCPPRPRSWSWSGSASCAGGSNRITGN
jgi:SRSO17 transposase